jgi:hypothetical protein
MIEHHSEGREEGQRREAEAWARAFAETDPGGAKKVIVDFGSHDDPDRLHRAIQAVHARRAAAHVVTPLDLMCEMDRARVYRDVAEEWRLLAGAGAAAPFPWDMDHVILNYWRLVWGMQGRWQKTS